jgi:2-polyprenyl-3-methyl-5-hydroxy-6-metoxy-1,4-benzoquinol methylase
MVYLDRWDSPPQEYTESYFFVDYKRQYGKTYLEDFSQLKSVGEGRLRLIQKLLVSDTAPKLLDIGCAYGPFLAAARDGGFDPLGLDPAGEAVDYVKKTLGIPALRGFFPEDFSGVPDGSADELKPKSFDVISLWYVIEHFREPRPALEALVRLLKPGGILALSTPSYNGVSRRKSPKAFLEQSPGDHWTIWDPRRCAGILKKFGFRVKKRVITGHHPERFPLIGHLLKANTALYRFFSILSVLFGLGDTFEVYAVKEAFRNGGAHG